jgi:hypothetical protein
MVLSVRSPASAQGTTQIALQGYFDSTTQAKIRTIWLHLAQRGIETSSNAQAARGVHPHMTLGSWSMMIPMDTMRARLTAAAGLLAKQPMQLVFTDSGTSFFFNPLMTAQLSGFHSQLHALLGDVGVPDRAIDLPANWPTAAHVTISTSVPPDTALHRQAVGIVDSQFAFPAVARLDSVAVVVYGASITSVIICEFTGEPASVKAGSSRRPQLRSTTPMRNDGIVSSLLGRKIPGVATSVAAPVVEGRGENLLVSPRSDHAR